MAKHSKKKKSKVLKIIGIILGSIVGTCAIVYLGGVALFATHYFPNTTVAGKDISLKTTQDFASMIDEDISSYTVDVQGEGLDFTITSDEAGISIDADSAAHAVLESTNFWLWPKLVFESRDLTDVLADEISASKLTSIVDAQVETINSAEGATGPTDAYVTYSTESHQYEIVPETLGTQLNAEAVTEKILIEIVDLGSSVDITTDELIQPTVFSNDERLATALENANALTEGNVTLTLDGNVVVEINSDVSSAWVTIDENYAVTFDDAALNAYVDNVANMCNTVGTERTYTRPDGKVCTVSGGPYGWEIDSTGLVDQVVEAVRTMQTTTIEIPVISSGSGFSGLGNQDWGARYIDVDLTEQHARFYGSDGSIIWEADFVSGNPNTGHATPTGVWYINNKQSPSTLVGFDENNDGEPDYKTVVTYWMAFETSAVGFHDATWQPYYGGSLYTTNGSHGCINLSYSSAQSLYGICEIGDVVVVHY